MLANDSALSKGTDEATGTVVYRPTGAPTEVALLTCGQKVGFLGGGRRRRAVGVC